MYFWTCLAYCGLQWRFEFFGLLAPEKIQVFFSIVLLTCLHPDCGGEVLGGSKKKIGK